MLLLLLLLLQTVLLRHQHECATHLWHRCTGDVRVPNLDAHGRQK
jgi:hypothetical protein